MKKRYFALCAVALAIFIAGCGTSTSGGKTLVSVNGEKITEGDLNFLGQINPRIQAQMASPDGKQRIIDNMVEQDLLYQEAVKEGINRDPKVKAKIDLYRKVIIAQSLVESDIEKSAKKYYDANQEEFKKLKLSDIIIKFASPDELKTVKKGKGAKPIHSEADALNIANEIKARLDKGEAFDAVAKETSEDSLTRTHGGDIGLLSKNDKRLTARGYGPLLEKAFEMKVGEIAGPIKTQDGYHIITVTRGIELQPFEDAKQGLIFKLRGDARNELLARLKKDAKISYSEELAAKMKKAEEAKTAEGAQPPAEGIQPPVAGEKAPEGTTIEIPSGKGTITVKPEKPAEQAKATPSAKAVEEKKAEPATKAAPEAKKVVPSTKN